MANATGGHRWCVVAGRGLYWPHDRDPLPPLRERLKLSDRFVDVIDQHVGEVFVLTGYGTHDGSARGAWIKKDELRKVLPPGFLPPKK